MEIQDQITPALFGAGMSLMSIALRRLSFDITYLYRRKKLRTTGLNHDDRESLAEHSSQLREGVPFVLGVLGLAGVFAGELIENKYLSVLSGAIAAPHLLEWLFYLVKSSRSKKY